MKITLEITPNVELVPYSYQKKLVGTIHKWLGSNLLHDQTSLYSFCWLMNGTRRLDSLDFPKGSRMSFCSHDPAVIEKLILGIKKDPFMFCGMVVSDIYIQENCVPFNREIFYCKTPVLVKGTLQDHSYKHYTFSDEETNRILKRILQRKMDIAGLKDDSMDVKFDVSYSGKRTEVIRFGKISNKVNICPVIVQGSLETKMFALNVGIGNSTGCGFGFIY